MHTTVRRHSGKYKEVSDSTIEELMFEEYAQKKDNKRPMCSKCQKFGQQYLPEEFRRRKCDSGGEL